MIRLLLTKVKPATGFANIFHILLLVTLPIVVFILVRLEFALLALIMVILSKWRMFAVRPRFWASNIRANSIDIIVGVAIVAFMADAQRADSLLLLLLWAIAYGVWLIVIKPRSSLLFTSLQAGIGQLFGISALYLTFSAGSLIGLTFATGLICFLAARHFFDSFNEPYARLLAYTWGYFGAAMAWLLSHWLLFYQLVAQPTLLLCVLGYGMAALYYLDHHSRLNKSLRRQFIFVMLAVVLVVLTFSDWGDKAV